MTEQRRLQKKYARTKQAAELAPVEGVFAEAWTEVSVADGFYRICSPGPKILGNCLVCDSGRSNARVLNGDSP
jgi:hypothetical protein